MPVPRPPPARQHDRIQRRPAPRTFPQQGQQRHSQGSVGLRRRNLVPSRVNLKFISCISFNNIANILRYLYENPPHNNTKRG